MRKSIRTVRLFSALIVLSVYGPDTALARGPCAEILATCEQAGFVRGGARMGNGLQIDCVRPIMAGTSQRPQSGKPLPNVNAELVAACKARNPHFGQVRPPATPGSEQSPATTPQSK
jgi:hypothetical protein